MIVCRAGGLDQKGCGSSRDTAAPAFSLSHSSQVTPNETPLAAQRGRTPAQIGASYRKWYGVDWPCAIRELTQLGVVFDPGWVARLMSSLEGHVRARAARRTARRRQPAAHFPEDADAHFAYVAGYTANGVSFGVTWEEWDKLNAGPAVSREEPDPF